MSGSYIVEKDEERESANARLARTLLEPRKNRYKINIKELNLPPDLMAQYNLLVSRGYSKRRALAFLATR